MLRRYGTISAFTLGLLLVPALGRLDAQAVCKDGTTSATTGRGACSGHGGVDKTAKKAATKAAVKEAKAETKVAKAEAKAVAKQVKCTDGTMSDGGRGACSGHGGIDRGATTATRTAAKAEVKAAKAEEKAATTEVTCTDGTKSAGGRGACSGHGGIAKSNPAQERAARAETRAQAARTTAGSGSAEDNNPVGAIAKCKDGMYSHAKSRQGACGHHGGVATWM